MRASREKLPNLLPITAQSGDDLRKKNYPFRKTDLRSYARGCEDRKCSPGSQEEEATRKKRRVTIITT